MHVVAITLTAILALAVTFRTSALATYGLSDDEVTKVRATDAYEKTGDFRVNAEHPMLMKLAILASRSAAAGWNALTGFRHDVPVEAAVRLPNAMAGAATVLVLYGVAHAYFGTAVALVAALLLALDPNATAINRIGKEDTFVVLFFLLGVWLYERGKQVGARDVVAAQLWYRRSAAAFGVMLASKYLPHLYGLYALANVTTLRDAGPNSPVKRRFFATMGVAFVIANFAILLPSTWRHMVAYVQGGALPHHGYPYANELWVTDVPVSPLGVPVTFYIIFLLTRLPLLTLAAAGIGLAAAVRHRRERGFVFLRVMLVFQLLGYSVMAAKFLRYSLPMLVLIDLLAAVGVVIAVGWTVRWLRRDITRRLLAPVAYAAVALALLAGQVQAAPYFAMHRNALAEWLDPDGIRFPETAYDYGVREATAQIAAIAGPGAEIVSDVPEVVRFYLPEHRRKDLTVRSFSGEGLSLHAAEQWVLVQDAHLYFETEALIAQLRMWHSPAHEYRVEGVTVLQVFRLRQGLR